VEIHAENSLKTNRKAAKAQSFKTLDGYHLVIFARVAEVK